MNPGDIISYRAGVDQKQVYYGVIVRVGHADRYVVADLYLKDDRRFVHNYSCNTNRVTVLEPV